MLAWCQTDVDTTGRNYYGEHSLYLVNTSYVKAVKTNEGPIYDVAWSPTGTEFIVISGYMPGKSVLYKPNGVKLKDEFIEVGTLFKVTSINGCGFDLVPINKNINLNGLHLSFPPEMIKAAFTETDYPG